MAHSVRIADGRPLARSVYIRDDVHARIWTDPAGHVRPAPCGNVGRFPFLSRLADPYADATVWPSEIPGFRRELELVAMSVAEGTPEAKLIADLIRLAVEAEQGGTGLECHGD